MRLRVFALAALGLALAARSAPAEGLSIGDPAPALAVSQFVKGEKVEKFEAGKLYVVEFWATWCGPCRTSIPHLTKLQKKYKDKVTFIGVSVWENDQDAVAPFVKEMGDKMEYVVAMDDVPKGAGRNEGKMATAWMKAAGEDGIPAAFIVNKDGKVAWIGHPMSMDKPLAQVVAGEYDLEKAASERREAQARAAKYDAVSARIRKAQRDGKPKDAIAVIDQFLAEEPKAEEQLAILKYRFLVEAGEGKAAMECARKLVDGTYKDNSGALNLIAWMIVDPESKIPADQRDLKLALKAAERANDLTHGEEAPILDTLAKAHFDNGNISKAVECQEKAIKMSEQPDPGMKDRLEQYRKAAEKNQK